MAEDQVQVKVSRVSMIAPAIPTVKHRMFLSSIDLSMIATNNLRKLLFYKTQKEFSTIVDELKGSLSLALVDFFPFAGRLDIDGGESGRPEVDCNDAGAEFVEAAIDIVFEHLEKDEFQHKSFFKELVQTRDKSYDASLLSIQVTAFQGGGICIGVNFHHVIADGASFWHFMKCWAELSRGLPISENPCHMRTYYKRDKESYSIPKISVRAEEVVNDRIKEAQILRFTRDDLLPMKNSEISLSTSDPSRNMNSSIQKPIKSEGTKLEITTFHFSEKMIQSLKERSGASSSFVAVAAQFWRCVMEAREVPENEAVYFALAVDCRGRVNPPLPPTYFGNCICIGTARTTAKQLLGQDIGFAAALIQELIHSSNWEMQLNNRIDWVESQLCSCDKDRSVTIPNFPKYQGRYIVRVAMSPKFPVYDIDHGWGRPLNVQAAFLGEIGGMLLFVGSEGRRSIALSTQLPQHQMERLKWILMIIPN